eukprot:2972338-Amphidinium_carterae.3
MSLRQRLQRPSSRVGPPSAILYYTSKPRCQSRFFRFTLQAAAQHGWRFPCVIASSATSNGHPTACVWCARSGPHASKVLC